MELIALVVVEKYLGVLLTFLMSQGEATSVEPRWHVCGMSLCIVKRSVLRIDVDSLSAYCKYGQSPSISFVDDDCDHPA